MADAPVTREELRQELSALRQDLVAMADRLTERMRDMQTELLKAFGSWQENIQARVR